MGKFVDIRNKYPDKQQQYMLCSAFFHDIIDGHPHSDSALHFFIAATATYIFTSIHDKSLKNNKHLHVIECAKPRNIETLKSGPYYRELGIDKDEGPYWCVKTNQYKLDVTYYQWEDIYGAALKAILSEGDQFELHEYIAYNHWKWGHKFISFWKSVCRPVSSNISFGSIIFTDGKYILISWLASGTELYAYRGYDSFVAICGGKQINVECEYNWSSLGHPASKLKHVNNTMWYISCRETSQIISTSRSNKEQLFRIMCHEKLVVQQQLQHEREKKALYMIHLGLKKIRRDLKLKKYGDLHHFAHQVGQDVWFDYLNNTLEKLNINVTTKGYSRQWRMLIAEANMTFCYQNNSYFQRNYQNTKKDIVHLSSMEFSMNTNSGYLRIDSKILKRNEDGLVQGLNSKNAANHHGTNKMPKDYYSLDTVLNYSIFYIVLQFMHYQDLYFFQRVSRLCAVLGKLKQLGKKYGEFMCILNS